MPTLIRTKNDVIKTNRLLDRDGKSIGGPGVWESGRSDGLGSVEVRRISITPAMIAAGNESNTRSVQVNTPGDEVLPSSTTDSNDIRLFGASRIATNSQSMVFLPTIPEGWQVVNIRINMTNSLFSEVDRTVEVFSRSIRVDSDSDQLYFHMTSAQGGTTNSTLSLATPFVQDSKGERYLCVYVARNNSSQCIIGGFISLKRIP